MWVGSKATNAFSALIKDVELEEQMDCKTEAVMKERVAASTRRVQVAGSSRYY